MLPCVLSDRCGCAVVRVATIVWFQREADEECGAEDIKVYTSNVRNMYRAITTRKTGTAMKLVCVHTQLLFVVAAVPCFFLRLFSLPLLCRPLPPPLCRLPLSPPFPTTNAATVAAPTSSAC